MRRFQKKTILQDLQKKMVVLAGPRQAGKTTLAKELAKEFDSFIYLNYDRASDRRLILDEGWLPTVELIVLDEIYKMPNWKGYLKGVYDTKQSHQKVLVTVSASLEIFTEVGDSLAGRFFLHRLFPFSPSELARTGEKVSLERLIERGGFPEPYIEEDKVDARRWRVQYADSLLKTDVLEFDNVQNAKAIRLVFELLRDRVGSGVSYTSIAEDVQISPNTVKKYIQVLEALYVVFRVTPYSKNISRSLMKEPKIYFFDNGLVKGDKGILFENLVATSLYKHVYERIDLQADSCALHYMKTKEGHEVDFVLAQDDEIEAMVEVKLKNSSPGRGIMYFKERYSHPAKQVVMYLDQEQMKKGVEILDGKRYLQEL